MLQRKCLHILLCIYTIRLKLQMILLENHVLRDLFEILETFEFWNQTIW